MQQYWQRPDGNTATRESMMMALADLEYIMVKATYSRDTYETSIRDVSMDIAEPRNTGQDRAYTVEQCNCPRGYIGTSCEVAWMECFEFIVNINILLIQLSLWLHRIFL